MSENQTGRPNVVMIVGDNHGRGAVGCYGQTGGDIETPNIDRLAADGLRFSNYFCSHAYCSGARATLLTGLMPSQHGVHSWLQDTAKEDWPDDWFVVGDVRTLPATLHDRGYRTAHVGKSTSGKAAPPRDQSTSRSPTARPTAATGNSRSKPDRSSRTTRRSASRRARGA